MRYVDPDGRETEDTADGKAIHAMILENYKDSHSQENVYGNVAMSTVLYELGIVDKGLGKTDLGLRPDIWNTTTNEMYEIKPVTQGSLTALSQLGTYLLLAAKCGKTVYAGSSSANGVSGSFMLNSATYVQYWSPRPGVILYSKTKIQKPQFDTGLNFNPQTGLAIGILIVGLAVSLYTGIPVFSY